MRGLSMYRIRIDTLYREVSGQHQGAKVIFQTAVAGEKKQKPLEGYINSEGHAGYQFTIPGDRAGGLSVTHLDGVILEFEVVEITEDGHEASDPQPR
jgi:hypothetical protein